jgi:O-antigen ligase
MIGGNYLLTAFPAEARNLPVKAAVVAVVAASCIATLWNPYLAALLIQITLFIAFLIVIRIHILQFLLLITIIPGVFPADFVRIANFAFSATVIVSLFWIASHIGLGYSHWKRNRSVELLVAINFLFALNMFFSSMYNSTNWLLTIIETTRFILYSGLIAVSYYFMNNFRVIQKVMWTGLAIAIPVAAFSFKTAMDMGMGQSIMKYGVALMRQTVAGFVNPNALATLIAFPMPILLAYLMFRDGKNRKMLCLIILTFLAMAWLSLNSRANYVYLFTAFLTLTMFHKSRKKYLVTLMILIALCIILIATDAFPLLTMLLRLEGGVTYRDSLWKAAMRMVVESPLLGKGPGFFDQFKFHYMDPEAGRSIVGIWRGVAPHSVLVMRAVDMGIIAVIIQIFFWVLPIVSLVKNAKGLKNSEYYYLYLASGAMWAGLVFRSLTDTGGSVIGMLLLPVIYRIPQLTKNQK